MHLDLRQSLTNCLHACVQVSNLARNATNPGPPYPSLQDMRWHMLTLTSQSDGSNGYCMYVDGKLAGQMQENAAYIGTYPSSALEHMYALKLSSLVNHFTTIHHAFHLSSLWHCFILCQIVLARNAVVLQ